jgi:ribosomal protein S18 acetylase RimI-like enzyme
VASNVHFRGQIVQAQGPRAKSPAFAFRRPAAGVIAMPHDSSFHPNVKSASATDALYYVLVTDHARQIAQVAHAIDFLSVQDFLAEEELVRGMWELIGEQYRTRSKFLAIWPSVRYLAVHRWNGGLGGFLLVSTPLNWQIDYVTVRQELRRRGIAASLVNEAANQARARGVPYVMLTSKPSLRPLYEGQCGFQVVAQSETACPRTQPVRHVS